MRAVLNQHIVSFFRGGRNSASFALCCLERLNQHSLGQVRPGECVSLCLLVRPRQMTFCIEVINMNNMCFVRAVMVTEAAAPCVAMSL